MVVPRNPLPFAPSIGANECENYPYAAQLHELFPASCRPSVVPHQAQLSKLYPAVYNPPGFPFHGGRFHHPYASTFQAHTSQARFPAAPSHRSLSIPPSAAAGACHSGLSPHCYYFVALPKNVKNAMVAATIFPKNFVSQQAFRPSGGTQGREHRSVGAPRRLFLHLLPSQACKYHEKKPCFDGCVLIDLSSLCLQKAL